ncbi:hypothetical protein K1T71_009902 [Dendrolimus kikuchii]|uniref:Uncharacterized protein n=1 Tax=Dendrolimus kikuchii TaxID=765133 RepID=A0ACC1CSY2_9NEOP|nr:hypothetical protein K1T71_009902 [Dendrolimus kikuchii]
MAPKKIDTGLVIILDIGVNTASVGELNKKSFLEEGRNFVARLIERKIVSQSTDYIGIVLLGSKETENNLNAQCGGGYRHIKIHAELDSPTWKLIETLPEKSTKTKGDWFDALIVAADHIKNGVANVKIANNKIILVTNFEIPSQQEDEQIEQVLLGFQEENITVDVIGISLEEESYKNRDLSLAKKFVEQTDGVSASFDHAMGYLQFQKKRKAINPHQWNTVLNIGPNIKIPITAYIKLKHGADVDKWIDEPYDAATGSASTTQSVDKQKHHINQENQTKIDLKNTIDAYLYGQEPIPIADCESMFYEPGSTCLSLYGFTKTNNIKWHHLNGNGLEYIFGKKGDTKAQYALRCLVVCMHEENLYGIARRVYRTNCAPKMYVLMPVFDVNNYVCLSMAQLCYKEEIKYMSFPPTNLKKYNCTDEQVDAFKDLIGAMDLTDAYDDTFDDKEAFPVGESVSPGAQYMFDCIAYRAMNPGRPLPQPRDEIMNLFKVPELLESRSKAALEKVKDLFPLKEVVPPKRRLKKTVEDQELEPSTCFENDTTSIPKVDLPSNKINGASTIKISTMDPISDFKALKSIGKDILELTPQMTEAIENLIYCNLDGNFTKAFEALSFFRSECVQTDPTSYNNWLQKFKTKLTNNKRNDILEMISENKVNFILKNENQLSSFETEASHEESQLYENDTVPDTIELTIASEINDMFDEM